MRTRFVSAVFFQQDEAPSHYAAPCSELVDTGMMGHSITLCLVLLPRNYFLLCYLKSKVYFTLHVKLEVLKQGQEIRNITSDIVSAV